MAILGLQGDQELCFCQEHSLLPCPLPELMAAN